MNGCGGEQRVVLLAMLVMGADTKVIVENLDRIEVLLGDVSEVEWLQLWECCRILGWARRGKQYDFTASWFEEHSKSLDTRMALLLLKRAGIGDVGRTWGRVFFSKCSNEDSVILEFGLSLEIGLASLETVDWSHVLYLSRRLKQITTPDLLSIAHVLQGDIPEDVAETVLSESDRHNEIFVSMCEDVYANLVAERAEKVSDVSKRDGWFEQKQ